MLEPPPPRTATPRLHARAVDWDTALEHIAAAFRHALAAPEPARLLLWPRGAHSLEALYLAAKLSRSVLGNPAPLASSPVVLGAGQGALAPRPAPDLRADLARADLVVLAGAEPSAYPAFAKALSAARRDRPRLRVALIADQGVEAAGAVEADIHLTPSPGSEGALFAGLLNAIEAEGAIDAAFVTERTEGAPEALAAARTADLPAVSATTGIDERALAAFYARWVRSDRVVTLCGAGLGEDATDAIANAHLASGRLGVPGAAVLALPDVQTGAGALVEGLLGLDDEGARRRLGALWGGGRLALGPAPTVQAMTATPLSAVLVLSGDPAPPLSTAEAAALDACPFVAVAGNAPEPAFRAEAVLPVQGLGESEGTVLSAGGRLVRSAPAEAPSETPSAEVQAPWQAVSALARALGGRGFEHADAASVRREMAALGPDTEWLEAPSARSAPSPLPALTLALPEEGLVRLSPRPRIERNSKLLRYS
ncbi:MAG: molybdopterin-dependent oxidoreductase [Pseudomonadota bacterium]